MQRHGITPRPDWREKVESVGLAYHTHDTCPYWDESAYYQFTAAEVDVLEAAANCLHQLCLQAVETVIRKNWWHRLAIPEAAAPAIVRSWERRDFSVYGRFDFAYDGAQPPKLLEYNADTPTSLIEAAVAQWFWLQERFPDADQFNSIHERLIEAWKKLKGQRVHFCSVDGHAEDEQTVTYLQDTCHQAGLVTKALPIAQIGWHEARRCFVDQDDQKIGACFKLYPWEWMWEESFSQYLSLETTRFIEPMWKMILSNKGLLPILWQLFPDHPNLLPCYDSPDLLGGNFARKPRLGREGSNVTLVVKGHTLQESGGDYGQEGFVYQALAPLADFDRNHPVLGVWVVDHHAAGMGIREDARFITGNLSRFVPHLFR